MMCIGYLPSCYIIEKYGVTKALTLGMALCTGGMWLCVVNELTTSSFFLGACMPLVLNTITKVSAGWFGPSGRAAATSLLLIGMFLPMAVSEII